mgnify:CR=1 FL=1
MGAHTYEGLMFRTKDTTDSTFVMKYPCSDMSFEGFAYWSTYLEEGGRKRRKTAFRSCHTQVFTHRCSHTGVHTHTRTRARAAHTQTACTRERT